MIYKEVEVSLDEEELDNFISNERSKITYSVYGFDELYNGVSIKNPTGYESAKYYVLDYNGATLLQRHVPFVGGIVPILEENVSEIIQSHIDSIIDTVVFDKLRVQPSQ